MRACLSDVDGLRKEEDLHDEAGADKNQRDPLGGRPAQLVVLYDGSADAVRRIKSAVASPEVWGHAFIYDTYIVPKNGETTMAKVDTPIILPFSWRKNCGMAWSALSVQSSGDIMAQGDTYNVPDTRRPQCPERRTTGTEDDAANHARRICLGRRNNDSPDDSDDISHEQHRATAYKVAQRAPEPGRHGVESDGRAAQVDGPGLGDVQGLGQGHCPRDQRGHGHVTDEGQIRDGEHGCVLAAPGPVERVVGVVGRLRHQDDAVAHLDIGLHGDGILALREILLWVLHHVALCI